MAWSQVIARPSSKAVFVWCMCSADHYLSDCAMHRRDYALAEQHRLSTLETTLRIADVMQQTIEVLGLSLCLMLMFAGFFFCLTIIGIPIGLTCFALGTKVLTLSPR
jgi:uncharacterized membrane protein YccF (DUF307 family)